jgi:hypothetical protein
MSANVGAGLIACIGYAGEETAGVVTAGVFTGGATIVGVGVVGAGDGNGILALALRCGGT